MTAAREERTRRLGQARTVLDLVANDTKIAVVVRDDLATWQKLNVTAFVASGLGTWAPELIGRPYEDASGLKYHPMFAVPVLVFAGGAQAVRRAFDRSRARGLVIAVYTEDLFSTDNDVDNRAAVAAVASDDLVVAGFSVAGERRQVDKALDKLRLHP